jgi:hypothetical protein
MPAVYSTDCALYLHIYFSYLSSNQILVFAIQVFLQLMQVLTSNSVKYFSAEDRFNKMDQ